MKNLEIMGIVNAYTMQKEQAAKARQEGKPVEEVRLPAAIAWKRRVNMDKLFAAKRLIDEAIREIQDRFSDDEHSVEAGNGARNVKPEYLQEFVKAQGDILSQDTEVDIRKVSIDDLGDVVLSDADMDTLSFMLKDGD